MIFFACELISGIVIAHSHDFPPKYEKQKNDVCARGMQYKLYLKPD